MLEDRSYMRSSPFDSRRSATLVLVVVNVVVFLAQLVIERFARLDFTGYLALSLEGLRHGFVWQVLTYQFMHANLLHLLVNCFVIYVFGREVEEALGRKSYLILYFASGVLGGLTQIAAGLLLGGYFAAAVVGASAAGFGVTAAYAMLFPDRIILLFFIIPMRAKYLLLLSLGVAVWGIVAPDSGLGGVHIADAAHLGGMITGIVFIRWAMHWTWRWPKLNPRRPARKLVRVSSGSSALWRTKRGDDEVPPEEFLSREVDPILDKISAQGIQSLTERERRILEAARTRMGRR